MGIIKRPQPIKLQDVDTPVEKEVVCVIEESTDGKTIEVICAPEEFIKESSKFTTKVESKPKAVITSTSTGEQFGSWIPSLSGSGIIDIDIRNANYVKAGQLVTCTFDIVVTKMTGGKKDSSLALSGLPITSTGSPDTKSGSAHISYFKVSNYDVRWISGTLQGSNNRVDLWCEKRGPGGLVPLTQIDINVDTVLVGTVTYISNS